MGEYCRVIDPAFTPRWFSVAPWVVLDALKHKERVAVWGGNLIGNIAAPLVYLLSRSRNGEESAR